MSTESTNDVLAGEANDIWVKIFGFNPDFQPDGWDNTGIPAQLAEVLGYALKSMLTTWTDVAAYQERQYSLAQQIRESALAKIALLDNPASAEAGAILRASTIASQSLQEMGDFALGSVSLDSSQSARLATTAEFLSEAAKAAGAVLAIGQMAAVTYDAITGEQTTHDVMSTAVGIISGTLAAEGLMLAGGALIGAGLLPAIVVCGAAIGAGYVVGKLSQEAYDQYGKSITDLLGDVGEFVFEKADSIADEVMGFFDNAQAWVQRKDPLTLDLDGDGLETTGVSSTNPILFDHDGDGVKNGTGLTYSSRLVRR